MTENASELDTVMEAISILHAWRTRGNITQRVRHRFAGEPAREYEVVADPGTLSYRVTDTETGVVDSFDGVTRTLVVGGVEHPYDLSMIVFEPRPARLAFPLALGIWGTSTGGYRITGGTDAGDDIVLDLAHGTDDTLRGTLTVSRPHRMAIRLETPHETLAYTDLRPVSEGYAFIGGRGPSPDSTAE